MTKNFPIVAARSALVIGTLALASAGCGGAATHHASRATVGKAGRPAAAKSPPAGAVHRLTPTTTEAQITTLQEHIGLAVKSVQCPRHVEIVNRRTFTCVTTLAKGAPIRTTVTPTNAAQGVARFQFFLPE
jgi:hypothetical protein